MTERVYFAEYGRSFITNHATSACISSLNFWNGRIAHGAVALSFNGIIV